MGHRAGHRRARRAGLGHRQPQRKTLAPGQSSREVDRQDGPHCGLPTQAVDHRCGLVPAHNDGCPAVGQLVLELGRRIQRVVLHDEGAQPQRGIEGHYVLWAVRQYQRHSVARPHTRDAQCLGSPTHLVGQLHVCRLHTEEVECDPVTETHSAGREHLGQRLSRDLDLGLHPWRVARQPRTLAKRAAVLALFRRARAVHAHTISQVEPTLTVHSMMTAAPPDADYSAPNPRAVPRFGRQQSSGLRMATSASLIRPAPCGSRLPTSRRYTSRRSSNITEATLLSRPKWPMAMPVRMKGSFTASSPTTEKARDTRRTRAAGVWPKSTPTQTAGRLASWYPSQGL